MRSLAQLKLYFRQKIKVVPGGPGNLTRGEGMLSALDALAEEVKNGGSSLLTLTAAQALPLSDPPAVAPNTLYGIMGTWNGEAANSTVYVPGVRPTSYHRLGVLYDAQGVAQLVEVDVVGGTYKKLSGGEELLASDNEWLGYNVFTKQLEIKSSFGRESTVIERFQDGTLFAYNQATGQDANFEGADFGSSNAPRDLYYYSDLAKAVAEYRDLPGKRVLWVQGGLVDMYAGGGPRGTLLRPYYSLAHAHDNAAENDTIMVLPGGDMTDALGRPCYGGYTQLTKNVTVCNLPGVIYAGTVDVGQFASEKPFRTYWHGGIILGALNVLRQSTGPSYFLGQDIRFEGIGYLHAFAQGTYGTHRDTIDIRRPVARQQAGAAQVVNFSGRSDGAQVQDVILTDFDFESVDSPFFNWGGSDGYNVTAPSQLILRGTGRMVRADGGAYLVIRLTTPFEAMLTEAQILVDERLSGGSGTGGGSGTSYTDAQARAAQLGRTAPAGTTTVTLTAQSPTDYGTIASGNFTIDAAGCVVGKCVRFAVGAGAGAPVFSNAPNGQPYKYLGVGYASGKAFSYSLLVCVDRIEVITVAD